MARTPKPGDNFPLSVISGDEQEGETGAEQRDEDAAGQAAAEPADGGLAEQLRQLREQVQALQATTAELTGRTARAVASGARSAGSKVADGAAAAGGRVTSGARATGEKVTETVEAYPFSAMLVASVVAFVLGRASAAYQPSFRSESGVDHMRHRLHDIASRLPPHLRSALRSSLR